MLSDKELRLPAGRDRARGRRLVARAKRARSAWSHTKPASSRP